MKTFLHLLYKEWHENKYTFLYTLIVVLLTVPFIFLLFLYLVHGTKVITESVFFWIYIFSILSIGILGSYQAFSFLQKRNKTMTMLTLPATTLQKWLVKFSIYSIFYLIFYTLLIFLLQSLILTIFKASNFEVINDIPWQDNEILEDFIVTLITYFLLQSFFYIGMCSFKKYAFVRTLVLVSVSIFLFITFTMQITENLGGINILFFEDRLTLPWYGVYNIFYSLPTFLNILKAILFVIGIPFLFFTASYFKFKEKEL